MQKTLDIKLARIREDTSCKEFILADAKDGDMGFGVAAPGVRRSVTDGGSEFRTLGEYRQAMRDITEQGLVDIMLMSASTSEVLTINSQTSQILSIASGNLVESSMRDFVVVGYGHKPNPELAGLPTKLELYSVSESGVLTRTASVVRYNPRVRLP